MTDPQPTRQQDPRPDGQPAPDARQPASEARQPGRLTGPTPLYAVAGAGDLAVATLRTALPALRAEAQEVTGRAVQVQRTLVVLPQQAFGRMLTVPGRAQAYVTGVGMSAAERAVTTYDGLAARGRDLVERIEQQPSARELQAQATVTARRAKAVVTTTRRSAGKVSKATARAADAAGSTAAAAASVVEESAGQVGEGGIEAPGTGRE